MSPDSNKVRPTSDRIKETLFNILQKYNTDGEIIDLFAGSGALGIEALSRGAESVIFVDNNPDSCRLIRANLDKLKITTKTSIWQVDYKYAIKKASTEGRIIDIILADPPYNSMYEQEILNTVVEFGVLHEGGILVIEHDSGLEFGHDSLDRDSRRCGHTTLSFFKKRSHK